MCASVLVLVEQRGSEIKLILDWRTMVSPLMELLFVCLFILLEYIILCYISYIESR